MKKILWMSRHQPLPSQRAALERHFGEVEVIQDPRPFDSAEDILNRFRQGGFGDIVVVAPLAVLGRLCDLGLKPLWAEMDQVSGPEQGGEVEAAGRWYRFDRFRRVKALRLEFEELE